MLNSLSELKFWIAKTLELYKGYQIKEWFLAADVTPHGDYTDDAWGSGDSIDYMYEWVEEHTKEDGFPKYVENRIGESLKDGRGDYYGWVLFEKEGREPIWIIRKHDDDGCEGWWSLCRVPNHLDHADNCVKDRDDEWEREYIYYEFEKEKRRGSESEIIFQSHTFTNERLIKKIIEDNVCIENWEIFGVRFNIKPVANMNDGYYLVFCYGETDYKIITESMSIKQISDFLTSAMRKIKKLKSTGKISFEDVSDVLASLESTTTSHPEVSASSNATV